MNEMTALRVGWFVGIYEGEGSCLLSRTTIQFCITMQDEDTIRRIQQFLGAGNVTGHQPPGNRVYMHRWTCSDWESVCAIRDLLLPYVSKRRREQILEKFEKRELLKASSPRKGWLSSTRTDEDVCVNGHPQTKDNVTMNHGHVTCLSCRRESSKRSKEKHRAV